MTSTATPIEVVTKFCAAWVEGELDAIVAFFAEDAIYHNIPLAPVIGPTQIRSTIETFTAAVEQVEFRVDAIAATGNTVLTERLDIFRFPSTTIELPVMGAFEVTDGKITAWRDYFDLNQFMSQLPSA